MAGSAWPCLTRHGQRTSRDVDLDHYLLHYYLAYCPVCSVLYQSDLHNEFHYAVCVTHSIREPRLMLLRMLILLGFASLVSWIVRYRFLNMYARLPPEPQRKEPQIDLFPDTQEGDSKPGLANYLDEFLSAIKVFGYRE